MQFVQFFKNAIGGSIKTSLACVSYFWIEQYRQQDNASQRFEDEVLHVQHRVTQHNYNKSPKFKQSYENVKTMCLYMHIYRKKFKVLN